MNVVFTMLNLDIVTDTRISYSPVISRVFNKGRKTNA